MTSSAQRKVLVLDADMVPCLTIARSLARQGCLVEVGSHIEKPLAGYSNTVKRVWGYPNPLTATQDFLSWLIQHTQLHDYDLVIPVTERSLLPISGARDELTHVAVAMPEARSLDLVLDKSQTMALAEELGVPVPGGVLLSSLEELPSVAPSIAYPVVLKPSRSIGSGASGASQLQVSYAFDERELYAGCEHALRFGEIILQEFFRGEGVGIELIARQGEIAYAFQHLRLHEVPLSGGGSSLRKSQPVLPSLLEASRKLIKALKWNGVAMVEFKLNQDTGEFCLMEINGRFWGSLPLADAAGADFPAMLLDLELDGEIKPCVPYQDDIHCRLASRDLGWYEAVLRSDADPRITKIPSRGQIFRELSLFFSLKHRFDVQKVRDPVPGLVDIGRIVKTYAARLSVLVDEKRFHAQQKEAWRRGEVAALIERADSILFMCYGNINRSALADRLVRAYAEDSGIRVSSAGFHEVVDRPADPVMVEVAASSGGDLSPCRSRSVSVGDLQKNDVIFVMEKVHYDRLLAMSPDIAGKTFLLGAHVNQQSWPAHIDDPYGGTREVYERCYQRIASAADALKAYMALRSSD